MKFIIFDKQTGIIDQSITTINEDKVNNIIGDQQDFIQVDDLTVTKGRQVDVNTKELINQQHVESVGDPIPPTDVNQALIDKNPLFNLNAIDVDAWVDSNVTNLIDVKKVLKLLIQLNCKKPPFITGEINRMKRKS